MLKSIDYNELILLESVCFETQEQLKLVQELISKIKEEKHHLRQQASNNNSFVSISLIFCLIKK
jgi:hypothetical protein